MKPILTMTDWEIMNNLLRLRIPILQIQTKMAWLMVIFFQPWIGLAAYLLIGENRLPLRRIREHALVAPRIRALGALAVQHQHAGTGNHDGCEFLELRHGAHTAGDDHEQQHRLDLRIIYIWKVGTASDRDLETRLLIDLKGGFL